MVVEADATRLSQVILNLLNNGAKYTEEGGQIWLEVEKQEGKAVVRVRDNGMGIAPELLPKVFDLFTQAERTMDRAQGGLGIGLTIVRRLIEMQGGTVEARSEGPGQGSEFIIRLPLTKSPSPIIPLSRNSAAATDQRGGLRVLVIDDHEDSAKSLSILLRHLGHEVRTAHDSEAALALARGFHPRVVFCDLGLPVMDGYEVARQLRRFPETRDTLLVALTGYGQEEDKQQSRNAGFHLHLVKPVGPEMLQELLGEAGLNGQAAQSVVE